MKTKSRNRQLNCFLN